ncbi:hypothetical protein FKM82_018899, partial [Ascaphus truei]
RWWAGEWQQCSTTCGPSGEKKRTVLCIRTVGSDEQALPSEACQHLTKPKGYVSCNRDILCPSDWTVSNWSECSVNCGGGVRTRNVTCAKNKDEPCDPLKKPNTKALCGLQQCSHTRKVPLLPIKYKNGKNIRIVPKKSGDLKRRILLPKNRLLSTTKRPGSVTSPASSFILSPTMKSIKDDFQINDIPNSTHFNVDYKYNFVLVENNKRKVSVNATSLTPTVSNEEGEHHLKNEILNVTERDLQTVLTTTHSPEEITPRYDFLTEPPEAEPEDIGDPDSYYDTEINSIIESRGTRHKGRSNMTRNNQTTIVYQAETSTQPSNIVITEIAETLNIEVNGSVPGIVISKQSSTKRDKNKDDMGPKASANPRDLQAIDINISEDLQNTSNSGLSVQNKN